MAETRMMPKNAPRSTGISQVATTGQPRPAISGMNGSHVSAAPGVTSATHQHVLNARSPQAAREPYQRQGSQAAKVEILARGTPGGGPGPIVNAGSGMAAQKTVTLMPRIQPRGPGGAPLPSSAPVQVAYGDIGGEVQSSYQEPTRAPVSQFSADHLLLIAALAQRYQESVIVTGEEAKAQAAGEILGIAKLQMDHLRNQPGERRAARTEILPTRTPPTVQATAVEVLPTGVVSGTVDIDSAPVASPEVTSAKTIETKEA